MPCGRLPKWRSNSRQPISIWARTALSLTFISGRKPCVAPQVISSSLPVSKKRRKPLQQVVVVLLDEDVAARVEAVVVHLGQVMELRLPAGAFDLLAGQGDQVVDVADVAVLQERIAEHGGQRRRDRHGQAPIDAVALQAVEDFQERDVGFGDGLVEPVFFEEIVVLGMADEGQMGVQDQA